MIDGYTIFMSAPNVQNDPLVLIRYFQTSLMVTMCLKGSILQFIYVRPFDAYTWTGIFLSLCAIIVAYAAMDMFFGVHLQLLKLCSFVARVMFSEPPSRAPDRYNYHKVLSTVTMLSLFILVQSYSGTLVSMFAAPSFNVPINR